MADQTPEARPGPANGYVSHSLPGRARIRIPERRGDAAYFARVRDWLAECDAVTGLTVSPVTGGVLVSHDGDLDAVARYAADNGLFVLPGGLQAGEPPITNKLRDAYGSMNHQVERATGGETDLSSLWVLVLIVISIIQLMRGNVLAPAITLLWYAISAIILRLTAQRAAEAEKAAEQK